MITKKQKAHITETFEPKPNYNLDLEKIKAQIAAAQKLNKEKTIYVKTTKPPKSTKTLLLTGGAGFIGHHTVEHILKNTDWNVVVIDRLNYAGSLHTLTDLEIWEKEKARVRFVYHDFRAPFLDSDISKIGHVDFIVHMGAETHVGNSLKDPRLFAESNVIGTLNMLELARKLHPEKMIYISTDEVYGPVEPKQLHKEGEPHQPSNPYAASKAAGEDFVRAYFKCFNVPAMITNTMNNVGERQNPEKFYPMVVGHILRGQPVQIHSRIEKGEVIDIASRCWIHPRNNADAILHVLKKGEPGQTYNIVGEERSVLELAKLASNALGKSFTAEYVDFHEHNPGHDMHYGLDGRKIKNDLGWTPPINLDQSLTKTALWMENRKKDWPLG